MGTQIVAFDLKDPALDQTIVKRCDNLLSVGLRVAAAFTIPGGPDRLFVIVQPEPPNGSAAPVNP